MVTINSHPITSARQQQSFIPWRLSTLEIGTFGELSRVGPNYACMKTFTDGEWYVNGGAIRKAERVTCQHNHLILPISTPVIMEDIIVL